MRFRKIVVTGSTGFLGRHVMDVFEGRYGRGVVAGVSSRDYDLTIGANSKDPDGSWAFIQHYLSPASQLEFAKAGVMPSRSSSYADRFFKEDALAKDLQAWSDYAKQHGRMEKTPKDFSKLSEELAKAIQKVLVQGADPKAALDEAAAAYNAQRS